MDGEGEAVRAKEETAEGQTSAEDQRGESHPAKREETENCEEKHGRGKTWAESANTLSEYGMHATAPPSSPNRSKKLK
jgi:hypothetical protein